MSSTEPEARAAYAAQQAELLAALLRGGGYPDGFVVAHADAAGGSLRRKRARLVRHAWPALAVALGDGFEPRFDAFARANAAPAAGGGLADGYAFARWLRGAGALRRDDVRVELLLARVQLRRRGDRRRRGAYAGIAWLPAGRRLLVAVRAPRLGVRLLTFSPRS